MDIELAELARGTGPEPLWAIWGVRALGAYLAAGIVFAIAFHFWGMRRVDPGAAGSTLAFRLLVTPGLVALWPWLARIWRRGEPRPERNAHRDAAATP